MTAMNDQFSREPRFICDGHLGKLCKYLRMLGFDCLFIQFVNHQEFTDQHNSQNRIVLSRDQKLKRHPEMHRFILIISSDPLTQLHEVACQIDLENFIRPLSRCLQCNHPLNSVPKEKIIHQLEPGTAQNFDHFFRCSKCGRLYWKGSHYENMRSFIKNKFFQSNNK